MIGSILVVALLIWHFALLIGVIKYREILSHVMVIGAILVWLGLLYFGFK